MLSAHWVVARNLLQLALERLSGQIPKSLFALPHHCEGAAHEALPHLFLETDGRITLAFQLACRDDLDALAAGESIADKHAVEIWDGSRLVARVKPGNAPLNTRDSHSL